MSVIDTLDLPEVCFSCTPPHWWSALAPEDWTPDARWGLSDRVLEPLELLHDRRWAHARAGDPAAAIALAIAYDRGDTQPALLNAMMSALVANALLGSAAARLVLIHGLSRRWRLDPARYERALHGWQELDRELGIAAAGTEASGEAAVSAISNASN
ncbi:hypothetical protein [Bosea sp. (in: a-proteobacteria)]|uniref:hypothetical protein n=1 Tax=Bosea sp. (in: a-proteobacteria) TaxID=1871050 RepID=UPI0027330072|nr:hypothetical protein [Bosea sp. (in: a-proteobacteria)]MDP3410525.1 hypothetical protein [Bosea sp. (in: a-proteobacteria)]